MPQVRGEGQTKQSGPIWHAKVPIKSIQCALGTLFGWMIWAASKHMTGQIEPWDSHSGYYFSSLFLAGVTAAAIRPQTAWSGLLGIYLGQVLYMIFELGPGIIPAPLAVLIFGTWPAIVGTAAGCLLGLIPVVIWRGLTGGRK